MMNGSATRGDSMRPGAVIASLVVLVVLAGFPLGWWTETAEHRQMREATATADADACRAAITTVQHYRAPGQQLTVGAMAELTAVQSRRPMRLGAWTARVGTANRCHVTLEAVVGNEYQRYGWTLDRGSGRITADDDATQRLSGW
jgi:hypothetical protein